MHLKCTYAILYWTAVETSIEEKYTCQVTEALKVTEAAFTEPTEIEGFIRKYIEGKADVDVKAFRFNNLVVEHILKGLLMILRNLTSLGITDCGLKQISKEDFCTKNQKLLTFSFDRIHEL